MKQREFGRFLIQAVLFASPLWTLLAVYFITDPFKVVRHYKSYYPAKGVSVVTLNSDYVSTQIFLDTYKTNNYNAYILGNSRSMEYHVADWEEHIGKQTCLHMNASDESIYGIEKKLELINKTGSKIDYALILLDYRTLKNTENSDGYLFEKHPALSGKNRISFQLDFLEIFFDARYLPALIDYVISGRYKDYMKNVMQDIPALYSAKDNEMIFYYSDSLIKYNPDAYYAAHQSAFPQRPENEQIAPVVIADKQKDCLDRIKNILVKHKTGYRFIISPAYDQIKFNPIDLAYLKSVFGADSVFDFSGINAITADKRNYYESFHYRPIVASQIMDSVYAKR